MNIFRAIASAPIRLVSESARLVNIATEKTLGVNLDVLDIEDSAKSLADEIGDERE